MVSRKGWSPELAGAIAAGTMTFAAINETSKQPRNRTPNLLKNGLHFLVAHENELPPVTDDSPTLKIAATTASHQKFRLNFSSQLAEICDYFDRGAGWS
jgi:hypothetical protein